MKSKLLFFLLIVMVFIGHSAKRKAVVYNEVSYGTTNTGSKLLITFDAGKEYNHPLYAIWLTDEQGKYIQTLYVSESVGKGVYIHNTLNKGIWMPGEIQRPATLPYWIHQRNIPNENGGLLPTPKKPVADAYTGATVKNSFKLTVITDKALQGKYRVYFEINQSWDWNEFWHNHKYPDNQDYKTSCQPALVYCGDIDSKNTGQPVVLKVVGHSHYNGTDGSLTTDLTTITTALHITKKIAVEIVDRP